MLRNIETASWKQLDKLLNNISQGIQSMIEEYHYLYQTEELEYFATLLFEINELRKKVAINEYDLESGNSILEYEDILKPFVFRCWLDAFRNGGKCISWFKSDTLKEMPEVVSVTFSFDEAESFCFARYGISYEITLDSYLGALSKDAATLVEKKAPSIFTIGKTADGKVINSYNLATPITTPTQVLMQGENNYCSKHNEIILDSRYIKAQSVVYTNDADIEMVEKISNKYNLPLEIRRKQ